MNKELEKRVKEEALYMIKTEETVRKIASFFHLSKSTVHKDLHERLYLIDYELFKRVDSLLQRHFKMKHIKGGESTKQKYLKERGLYVCERYWN